MKIAFLSPSLSRNAGGIFEITKGLAIALSQLPDTAVAAFGLTDAMSKADVESWRGIEVHFGDVVGPNAFGYSPALRRMFTGSSADVAHLHALWMYPSILVRHWAERSHKPYVITLNGMLEPWALRNSSLKKTVAAGLYETRSLRGAGCIQVNTESELQSALSFGLSGPFCIVPNGVNLPDLERAKTQGPQHVLQSLRRGGAKVLLYLGRIHAKKNLPAVIDAFQRLVADFPDWILAIAGWDQLGHIHELQRQVSALGLGERIVFLGPQFGAEKASCLSAADAVVLASHSEGLPMAVLEAWSYAKPVVMTPECNLDVGFDASAAIKVETDTSSIADGLRTLFQMSDAARRVMGGNGRQLVERKFSWPNVAAQMRSVYDWLLDGGRRPDCVVTPLVQ